jgi:signal transduction histidine kinase
MDAMIDSMLTVARADRTVPDTDRLPLRELVTEAWASTTADDASLQADIPSEIFVDGDRRLLGDVFEHLFQNSIEHNDTPVTVTVTLLDGDSTGIAVEDDGDGIPADQREEVFDQGFTMAEDSVGFSLAIVERFLAAHGWDAAVTEGTAGGA